MHPSSSQGIDELIGGGDDLPEGEDGAAPADEDLVFSPLEDAQGEAAPTPAPAPSPIPAPAFALAAAPPAPAPADDIEVETAEEEMGGLGPAPLPSPISLGLATPRSPPASEPMDVDPAPTTATAGTATLQALLLGSSRAAMVAGSPTLELAAPEGATAGMDLGSADLDEAFGPASALPSPRPATPASPRDDEDAHPQPGDEAEAPAAAPPPSAAPSELPMEEGMTGRLLEAEDGAPAEARQHVDLPLPTPLRLAAPAVPHTAPSRTFAALTGGATGLLLQPTPATARHLASAGRPSLAQLSPTALVNQVLGRRAPESAQPGSRFKSAAPASARKLAREISMFTPALSLLQAPAPPPPVQMTFQDFLKEAEVQFLDQLRRGTSLGMGDLAIDPPPATLKDAYRLMCITQADVQTMENGIATLQDEISARRARIGEKELALSAHNPEVFRKIQTTDGLAFEEIKGRVQMLKKVCRAQTLLAWKEWRLTLERRLDGDLTQRLALLTEDRRFLEGCLEGLREVHGGVLQMSADLRRGIQARAEARRQHRARAQSVQALEEAAAAQHRALQAREALQKEEAVRLGQLEAQRDQLARRKQDLRARLEVARQRAAPAAPTREPASAASTQEAEQSLAAAAGALAALRSNARGLTIEAVRGGEGTLPSEVTLAISDRFRLRVCMDAAEGGRVSALEVRVAPGQGPVESLALGLARCAVGDLLRQRVPGASASGHPRPCVLAVSAPRSLQDPLGRLERPAALLRPGVLLQQLVPQLQSAAQLLKDLEVARQRTPTLAGVAWSLETNDVSLTLHVLDPAREGRVGVVVVPVGRAFSRLRVAEVKVEYARPGSEAALQQAFAGAVGGSHASVLQLCSAVLGSVAQ